MNMFKKLVRDNAGATAIEYGLIAALVAVAAIGSLTAVGGSIDDTFSTVDTELKNAQPTP